MTTIPFTEFRRNASDLFSRVEQGEMFVVMRHGHPVAEISPVSTGKASQPSWKRPGLKLVVKGGGLSAVIRKERSGESRL